MTCRAPPYRISGPDGILSTSIVFRVCSELSSWMCPVQWAHLSTQQGKHDCWAADDWLLFIKATAVPLQSPPRDANADSFRVFTFLPLFFQWAPKSHNHRWELGFSARNLTSGQNWPPALHWLTSAFIHLHSFQATTAQIFVVIKNHREKVCHQAPKVFTITSEEGQYIERFLL